MKTAVLGCALLGGLADAGTVLDPKLSVNLEERYDDDALVQIAGAGQLMTKVSPRIGLEVKDPTFSTDGWYAADVLVRHGSGDATLDHRFGVELKKSFSRRWTLRAQLQGWRVSDPSSLPRMGVARTNAPVLYGKGELTTSYRMTERLTGRVGYAFEAAKVYSSESLDAGFMHAPHAALTYALTRRASIGAEYRFQQFALGTDAALAHGAVATFGYYLARPLLMNLRAGPVYYEHKDVRGWVPRASLELQRDGQHFDWGFVIGHDLVGASGFTAALWADYASVVGDYRFSDRLRTFGAASYFRNGRAPDVGWGWSDQGATSVSGYAVGAGVEWSLTPSLALQGTFDRYAQVAAARGFEAANLARNIVAARLVWTAF